LLLLPRVTVSGCELSVLRRVTVPTAAEDGPGASTIWCGAMLTCKLDGTRRVSRDSTLSRGLRDLSVGFGERNNLENRDRAQRMMRSFPQTSGQVWTAFSVSADR
jgi:hypothetical protein